MRNRTVLLASTLLLAVLYIAGAVALGTTPDADDGGPDVASWFRDNGGHVQWWLWLATLSVIVFAVFASLIRRQLPAPHRDVFFFGAIALAVEGAVQGWIWAGLSWHADQLDPATARTLLDVASFWGPVLTSATILMLAPVTVLAWRGQAGLPRWLAVVTGVAVIEQLIETITIFGQRGFTAPGGPMNLFLGAGLVLVAFVSLGIATAGSMTD
jgi:hypothetical protein